MLPVKPLLVYLHGVPGAPLEARWLEAAARDRGIDVFAPDRFVLDSALQGDAYFQALARQIADSAQGHPVHLVGFSMGAFVALQTSRFLPQPVHCIHLVSAAAPLDCGDFLDALAGKQVFRMAQRSPWLFALLSRWQGLMARMAPQVLFRMLFASARGADVALAQDAAFQSVITAALQRGLGAGQAGYQRDVLAYVQPWAHCLVGIHVPVCLWHGDADNWSVPAMAHYLEATLPAATPVRMMPGLSHYSCLLASLPMICTQVAA